MNNFTLRFSADIHCQDEVCGQLEKVIFNPETREVTDLVIEKGHLLSTSRIIPVSKIESAVEEVIKISVPKDELADYPEYKETYIEEPPEGRQLDHSAIMETPYGMKTGAPPIPKVKDLYIEGIADHLAPMGKDTPVKAVDSTVGNVYGVVVTPNKNYIIEVLVHKGLIFVDEFLLSAGAVERMSIEGVFLDMTKDELDTFIEYDDERDHYWDQMSVE